MVKFKEGNNNPVCETAKETQMFWTVFWILWERVRAGWYGRMALKHVKYHMWNKSPVLVWCMIQGAWLENLMDGGACWAAVHGVAKSQTRLKDFTFTFHFHALEKEMATHSSVLTWRILGTGKPGGLPSMGSHRVGHDWSDLAAVAEVKTSG